MGEIADAMLDVTLCGSCGMYIGFDQGFPGYCPGCEPECMKEAVDGPHRLACPHCGKRCKTDQGLREHIQAKHETAEKTACGRCGKKVAATGLWQHMRDKHGDYLAAAKDLEDQEHLKNLVAYHGPHFTQKNAVARMVRRAIFDDTGWTKHTDAHYSRSLLGDRLDYWPGRLKWRWRGKTQVGDVDQFIQQQVDTSGVEGEG